MAAPCYNQRASSPQKVTTNALLKSSSNADSQYTIDLLQLPYEILNKILSYLNFTKVGHLRRVCRTFDGICQEILNSSFKRVNCEISLQYEDMMQEMTGKEMVEDSWASFSGRKEFILHSLHIRMLLLDLAFGSYIKHNLCCFFAGEILDRFNTFLFSFKGAIELEDQSTKANELFEMISVAMVFFQQNIEVQFMLKDKGNSTLHESGSNFEIINGYNTSIQIRQRIHAIKRNLQRYEQLFSSLLNNIRSTEIAIIHEEQLCEYPDRIRSLKSQKLRLVGRISVFEQEMDSCKQELQYWQSYIPIIDYAGSPPLLNLSEDTFRAPGGPYEEPEENPEDAVVIPDILPEGILNYLGINDGRELRE